MGDILYRHRKCLTEDEVPEILLRERTFCYCDFSEYIIAERDGECVGVVAFNDWLGRLDLRETLDIKEVAGVSDEVKTGLIAQVGKEAQSRNATRLRVGGLHLRVPFWEKLGFHSDLHDIVQPGYLFYAMEV
tara:strand:- start:504 stop:899 length:396 start_codon:yes stop_codon:yes gene_type:complete